MTITYSLAPNPKWYIADLVGLPLAGGTLFSYRSLNKNQYKPIFMDPAGLFPWTQPILFDENGSQGPFYFQFDTAFPDETYYLEVYDSSGVLQWTIDNFSPPGAGGGGTITTALDLENLIANNVFYRNIGTSVTPLPLSLTVAPGNHEAFAANAQPDTFFIKNNTNAVDQISFPSFVLGATPLTGDVTPVQYLRYECTNSPTGETLKQFQFPITTNVQNLTNQNVAITLWGFLPASGGSNQIILQWVQFFGDGTGGSPTLIQPIQTLTLTTTWQKFIIFDTVPNVSGKIIGTCGNSALYLIATMPLNASCDIGFTKPAVYLGNFTPTEDYQTYDEIDTIINSPRTGDLRFGFNNFTPYGWIFMDDRTIGSATSGATNRANTDTFPLYYLLWNAVIDQWAPVVGGRGASAIADFDANKAMSLTKALGRVFAGTLNTFTNLVYTANFLTLEFTMSSTAQYPTGAPVNLSNVAGALPSGLSSGASGAIYYVINVDATHIKLAPSVEDAILGNAVPFTDNGSGTNFVRVTPFDLGEFLGVETTPTIQAGYTVAAGGTQLVSPPTNNAYPVVQPTTYTNVFIKM